MAHLVRRRNRIRKTRKILGEGGLSTSRVTHLGDAVIVHLHSSDLYCLEMTPKEAGELLESLSSVLQAQESEPVK